MILPRRAVLALAATALCVAPGCIPVPGNHRPMHGGMRPEEKIGRAPHSLLRAAESSRDRVVAVLGPPHYVTRNGRSMVYQYSVIGAWWVYAFPFGVSAYPREAPRALRLDFDASGTLATSRVYGNPDDLVASLPGAVPYDQYRRSVGAGGGETPLPPLGAAADTEGDE